MHLFTNQCGQFSRSDKQYFSHNGEILQAFTFDNRSCKKVVKYELITAAGSRHRVPGPLLGMTFLFMMCDLPSARHSKEAIPSQVLNLS